ncbi:tectonic-like complex member MKS1 [Artemia franciscana]|uniref:Meckel syndrome type 1 protein n=1 Tax=Artemia franciscana TaxID=6661 RepID=A0AA88HDA1_ARTSF|nr:hypothetical protein QYM36_013996 [Artemia franciscana]
MDAFRIRVSVRIWKKDAGILKLVREIIAKFKWQQKKFSKLDLQGVHSKKVPLYSRRESELNGIDYVSSPIFTYINSDSYAVKNEIEKYRAKQKDQKLPCLVKKVIKARKMTRFQLSDGKKHSDPGTLLSTDVTAYDRLRCIMSEVMYVMLDLREVFGENFKENQVQLVRLAYRTKFTCEPDFSKDDEPPYSISINDYVITYWIHDVSKPPKIEPIQRPINQIETVYVDIPDISEVIITICGEIAQANDYPGTMLYMKYAIVTPKGWKALSKYSLQGTTQRCRNKNQNAIFSHPLYARYRTDRLKGDNQTKLLFQVFSFEGGQSTFQGFSILKVPISPGMQQIKAITWKPFYKSTRKRVLRRAPYKEFKMPDVTTLAETISFYGNLAFSDNIDVQPTGSITLNLNVILQNSSLTEKQNCKEVKLSQEGLNKHDMKIQETLQAIYTAKYQLSSVLEKFLTYLQKHEEPQVQAY